MTKSTSGATQKVTRNSRIMWKRVTTIGIDVGDRTSQCCTLSAGGEIVAELRVATTPSAMEARFKSIGRKRIAIETGTHSPWISRLLGKLGHEVIVANARKVRLIYENRRKDDRIDARSLARLARLDPELLAPIQHRSETAQSHLEMIRARDVLVTNRTRLVNHLRGALKPFGVRLSPCSPSAVVTRSRSVIPSSLASALTPLVEMIHTISLQIRDYDRRIEQLAKVDYPDSQALQQVSGVGALTALAFMLTLGDPRRFRRSRQVGPWLGLVPARNDSGDQRPQMRITKEGDHYVRRLLVGSAQYILGPFAPDCDLRRHGLAIAQRGGKNAKKRAAVAVARKLAVLLHQLWISQAIYEPLRTSTRRSAAA